MIKNLVKAKTITNTFSAISHKRYSLSVKQYKNKTLKLLNKTSSSYLTCILHRSYICSKLFLSINIYTQCYVTFKNFLIKRIRKLISVLLNFR